jgi:hypothetical protein
MPPIEQVEEQSKCWPDMFPRESIQVLKDQIGAAWDLSLFDHIGSTYSKIILISSGHAWPILLS